MDKTTSHFPLPGPSGPTRRYGGRSATRHIDDAALALGVSHDADGASPATIGDGLFTRPALSDMTGRVHI